jgi:alpha-ketoglutaric semialdehyde dehydrogenase
MGNATMTVQQVLIDGQWTVSTGISTFQAVNPRTREPLPGKYPISPWSEIVRAIESASRAAAIVRDWSGDRFAAFVERYADRIDARAAELIEMAHQETALPVQPRLKDAELPRTSNQLRQAAAAARDGSWTEPTIDTVPNIRSMLRPIGPVVVFGPNNFPFAFNSAAGGDFAAAIAAGNPVIAKGHSSHPGTTRILAEEAQLAANETGMPAGFVQLIYRTNHDDGKRLVSHPSIGASGYTGSRSAGSQLKEAADRVGKPIYLELSSINPIYILPGAIRERSAAIAEQFATSCLMGAGQFCTNPGLIVLKAGAETEDWIRQVGERFSSAPVGTLLGPSVQTHLESGFRTLVGHGATLVTGGSSGGGAGYCCQNTLLRVTGSQFISSPAALQTEMFGNASLIVVVESDSEFIGVTQALEGNLTGCLYTANDGSDDALYGQITPILRQKVGRLLNDKMPTGVAVVSAMNHGGPFPATGHPGFTAVGIPASLKRFAMLQCYDGVRPNRLPAALADQAPSSSLWRLIDGRRLQGDVPATK